MKKYGATAIIEVFEIAEEFPGCGGCGCVLFLIVVAILSPIGPPEIRSIVQPILGPIWKALCGTSGFIIWLPLIGFAVTSFTSWMRSSNIYFEDDEFRVPFENE